MIKKRALITDIHSFSVGVPSSVGTVREKFEWRQSRGPEIKVLAIENVREEDYSKDNSGMKLVNVNTKQLVAVFLGGKHLQVHNPKIVAGRLRFINTEHESDGFRKVVVLSILSILMRE